jgi:hypothetical protein
MTQQQMHRGRPRASVSDYHIATPMHGGTAAAFQENGLFRRGHGSIVSPLAPAQERFFHQADASGPPAIDAIASFVQAPFVTPASARLPRVNGTISTAAVAAVAVTAFGYEAGSALAAFGAWAAVSGSIQLGTAIRQRRPGSRQLPMIISGGLSTVAGAGFIAASGMPAARLANVAGYMALGAVFYLLWAYRSRTIATTGR